MAERIGRCLVHHQLFVASSAAKSEKKKMVMYNLQKMKKNLIFAILLIVTLVKVDSTFAKAISNAEKPNLHDDATNPGFRKSFAHGLPFFAKSDSGGSYERTVADGTKTPEGSDKIASGNIMPPDESAKLPETLSPVFIANLGSSQVANINSTIEEKADDLSTSLKPGDSLAVTQNPGSWTADSLVTSSESVSGGTESLVTSLKPDSGELASFLTDSNLGILPAGFEPGSGVADGFTTTFLPATTSLATTFQSDSQRLEHLFTTIKPDSALTVSGPDSGRAKESPSSTTLKPLSESPDNNSKTLPSKNRSSSKIHGNESSRTIIIVLGIISIFNLRIK